MATYISRTRVRNLLNYYDDTFINYEPSIPKAGREMANSYIKKITDRMNYIIGNLLHKGLIWQETTDMFPDDSTIDYWCTWTLEVNLEKQTIDIDLINCSYQKAVMLPFIKLGEWE